MKTAGIVLCGGRSSRMGAPKASLPFGPERMLQRVVRLLSGVVDRIVVVAAPGQSIPALPAEVTFAHDRREGQGPLEGLAAGLTALGDDVDAVYATSCDVPLLVPAFVQRMFDLLEDHAIAVPRDGEYHHPLAAVYRPTVRPQVEQLIAAGRMRPVFLFERVRTRQVRPDEWIDVDPGSCTLSNLNRPEDYLAALAAAGYEAPPDVMEHLRGSK